MDVKFCEDEFSGTSILGPGNSTYFDLSRKGLKNFPTYLYNHCANVKCLYLEDNIIDELDESFFPSLKNLEWLDIRKNRLCTLPKTIGHHPNLQVLLLQDNKIETLPLELGLVPKLRGIQVSGNPLVFPPPQVVEKGVEGIMQFLREERDIQAPSPSTIRPIAEPFYKANSPPASRTCKYKPRSGIVTRKPHVLSKKRASSSNLPVITVKSYQKLQQEPTTIRPMSQYKLVDSNPVSDMSESIHSVGSRILEMWPNPQERSEVRIQENLLKEMFIVRIRDMLSKQAAIIQRCKDRETLSNWRKSGSRRVSCKAQSTTWPYDIDPTYMTMLSRAEIHPSAQERTKKPMDVKSPPDVNEEMSEIYKTLQQLDNSKKDVVLSPRTEQSVLNNEIQTLVRLQKKLQVLHLQNVSVPSLPVRGHRINK